MTIVKLEQQAAREVRAKGLMAVAKAAMSQAAQAAIDNKPNAVELATTAVELLKRAEGARAACEKPTAKTKHVSQLEGASHAGRR